MYCTPAFKRSLLGEELQGVHGLRALRFAVNTSAMKTDVIDANEVEYAVESTIHTMR